MKYSVLIALLGMVGAKHHHHKHHSKSLAQMEGYPTPALGESNKSFVPAKAAAAAVVAKQQSTETKYVDQIHSIISDATSATHTKKSQKTKARVDQIDNEVYQNPYWTRKEWVQRPPPALAQVDPLGEQNASFGAGKAAATKVVADQVAQEAENTADITGSHDKEEAAAKNAAADVRIERIQQ